MAFDVNKVILPATILYRHSSAEVDGIQSTEEESAVCKEHLFVISDFFSIIITVWVRYVIVLFPSYSNVVTID